MWKNKWNNRYTETPTTGSVDISFLFNQKLHQNVGNFIAVGIEEIDKKSERQKEGKIERETKRREDGKGKEGEERD